MKLRQGETLSGILKPLILLTSPSTRAQTFAKCTLIGDSPPPAFDFSRVQRIFFCAF